MTTEKPERLEKLRYVTLLTGGWYKVICRDCRGEDGHYHVVARARTTIVGLVSDQMTGFIRLVLEHERAEHPGTAA